MSALVLQVGNDMAELARVSAALDEFCLAHSLDEDTQADLNIVAEEVLSNVIRHGGGASQIVFTVTLDPAQLRIECCDSGAPFDPLRHETFDPDSSLDERRAGGMGLFMVIKMMDEARYEFRKGFNCFTLVRHRAV